MATAPTQRAYTPNDFVSVPEHMLGATLPDQMPSDSPYQFEQRVLRPSQYPVMMQKEGIATHKMMNGEAEINGQQVPIAFPSVVYNPQTKQMQELAPRDAFKHAMSTGEFRQFDNPDAASTYAEGAYKKHWGQGDTLDAARAFIQRGFK